MFSTTTAKIQATITGLPQTISVPFGFQYSTDLLVLDSGASYTFDPPTTLTLASDYTVTGGGYNSLYQMQTGSITVNSGGTGNVQINDVITILRQVPATQTTSSTMGVVTNASWEVALDKLTLLSQQNAEWLGRCLYIEQDETLSTVLLRNQRLGLLLGFSSTGAVTCSTSTGTSGVFVSASGTPTNGQLAGWVGPNQIQGITVGTGLTLTGTTLTSSGGLSGGTNTQVIYFTGATTYASNSGFVTDTSGNVTVHGLTVSTQTTAGIITNNGSGVYASLSNASSVSSTLAGILGSNWSSSTSLFLRADGSWQTPAGSGNVSNTGTPTSGQIAQWATSTVIKGVSDISSITIGAVTPSTGAFTYLGVGGAGSSSIGIYNTSTQTAGGNNGTSYGYESNGTYATTNSGYTGLSGYALYLATPTVTGTSGLSVSAQLYIATGATATTHYGIYQAGTDNNYLAGALTMSTAALKATNQNLCPATTTVSESTGAATINWANGNSFYLLLNASCTLTFSNAVDGQSIIIKVLNTASNYTLTWPTVKWFNGTAPTMSTGAVYDVYTITYDSAVGGYFGGYLQNVH